MIIITNVFSLPQACGKIKNCQTVMVFCSYKRMPQTRKFRKNRNLYLGSGKSKLTGVGIGWGPPWCVLTGRDHRVFPSHLPSSPHKATNPITGTLSSLSHLTLATPQGHTSNYHQHGNLRIKFLTNEASEDVLNHSMNWIIKLNGSETGMKNFLN